MHVAVGEQSITVVNSGQDSWKPLAVCYLGANRPPQARRILLLRTYGGGVTVFNGSIILLLIVAAITAGGLIGVASMLFGVFGRGEPKGRSRSSGPISWATPKLGLSLVVTGQRLYSRTHNSKASIPSANTMSGGARM